MPEYLEPRTYIEEVNSACHNVRFCITGVSTSTAAFIDVFKKGPTRKPTLISSPEEFDRVFGGIDRRSEASFGISQFFINGGKKAMIVRVPGRNPPGERSIRRGLKILASNRHNLVNILCVPAAANLNDTKLRSVYDAAIKYCEDNRVFLIIDIPERVGQPNQILEWVSANYMLRSGNTAVYFPWLEILDPSDPGQKRAVSPSGTIAGIFSRTDSERGVWKAPGGNEAVLNGVSGLSYEVTDNENTSLIQQGINCIRKFPDKGILCWGARTLEGDTQGDPEWKYISLRRFFLYIEGSLARGTEWAIFEPNGEPLWLRLRKTVVDFLITLWKNGALAGTKIEEAFFVRCDRSTMTQEEIDRGVVNILVGVAPLRPTEFIILRITQRTG